jgi:hypothetical protein
MAADTGACFHPSRLAAKRRRAPQDDDGVVADLRSAQHGREALAAKTAPNRRLTEALLAMANDMRASGVLSKASYDKIIKRHVVPGDEAKRASPKSITTIGGYGFRARAKKRVPE